MVLRLRSQLEKKNSPSFAFNMSVRLISGSRNPNPFSIHALCLQCPEKKQPHRLRSAGLLVLTVCGG